MIELFNIAPASIQVNQNTKWSPWILRMELNSESLAGHRISIEDIANKIRNQFKTVNVMNSDVNDEQQIIRF